MHNFVESVQSSDIESADEAPPRRPKKPTRSHMPSSSRESTPQPPSSADSGAETPPSKSRRRKAHPAPPAHLLSSAMPARKLPLLICSIGNPGAAYANTLHSAGHTVLQRLADHLGYAPFRKERELGGGLVSRPYHPSGGEGEGGDWTLWQSPSYMNDSGKAVRAAYTAWRRALPQPADADAGQLVVLHDELEKPLGALSVRSAAGASAKGHNGLKSVMAALAGTGRKGFVRLGVGIGRPEGRGSEEVAGFVLRKMTGREREVLEGCVGAVVERLRAVEQG